MTKLTKICEGHIMYTKISLVKTMVFYIFCNGSECWSLKDVDKRTIDWFGMFCCWILWTVRRANESILRPLHGTENSKTVSSKISPLILIMLHVEMVSRSWLCREWWKIIDLAKITILLMDHITKELEAPLSHFFTVAEAE